MRTRGSEHESPSDNGMPSKSSPKPAHCRCHLTESPSVNRSPIFSAKGRSAFKPKIIHSKSVACGSEQNEDGTIRTGDDKRVDCPLVKLGSQKRSPCAFVRAEIRIPKVVEANARELSVTMKGKASSSQRHREITETAISSLKQQESIRGCSTLIAKLLCGLCVYTLFFPGSDSTHHQSLTAFGCTRAHPKRQLRLNVPWLSRPESGPADYRADTDGLGAA